jgi:hypothetical protein
VRQKVDYAVVPVEAFQQWLAAQGEQLIALRDVLAQWLTDYFGERCFVTCSFYETWQGGYYPAPIWMRCFFCEMQRQFLLEWDGSGGLEGPCEVASASVILGVLQTAVQAAAAIPRSFDWWAFRSWVESRRMAVVGAAGDFRACPLANWLTEQCGEPYVVGLTGYGPVRYGEVVDLPDWAMTFVNEIDGLGVLGCREVPDRVTGVYES